MNFLFNCLRFRAPLLLAGCAVRAQPTSPRSPSDLGPVGNFSFTERSGKTITQADLLGKVWVASFVFTSCSSVCPQVSGSMSELNRELPDRPDLRLVTFTVDPDHDTPEKLRTYAESFGAGERLAFPHRLLRETLYLDPHRLSSRRGAE